MSSSELEGLWIGDDRLLNPCRTIGDAPIQDCARADGSNLLDVGCSIRKAFESEGLSSFGRPVESGLC